MTDYERYEALRHCRYVDEEGSDKPALASIFFHVGELIDIVEDIFLKYQSLDLGSR